ncbi:serine hydrolase domain-containing protein [Catellatospora tritici]|uniref:serine hydrolase domain-containing protein n=1 Tax=Catellatospora tritici TaxID=2851566 RepID=UPI001C2CE2B9|nr:serine hydrolase domain-containing protein [Catellatospora tritici]MBV1850730.1 beta-lactamase family protein [Catellatospora tritici]MBV1850983.1 beta-lactamase family protein [Catellatospora tritici]
MVLSLVLVAAASACGQMSVGQWARTAPEATPPAYAAGLEAQIQAIMDNMSVPGAVVMITSPEQGDWTQTFGRQAVVGNAPVTVDDRFRIGSNTKTMTGTVLLQLAQEGKIGLDDPVSKYQPQVPNGDNITIAQLLEMRSGLYNYSEDEQFNARIDNDPGYVWQPEELLSIAFAKPPYFAPGAGFHYSNTNLILAGLIIEQLTGGTLQDAYQQRIFGPLGLGQTLLPPAADASIPAPHPQGYMFGTNVSTLNDPALPPAEQAAAAKGDLLPRDVTDSSPSWTWAAGGVISTAADLTRYVTALVGGGLLDPAMQKTRMDSIKPIPTPDHADVGYGLAIVKFGPLYGHDGQIPGYNSFMAHDPASKNTVIVLTSLFAGPNGKQPANVIAEAIIKALYGESLVPSPSSTR